MTLVFYKFKRRVRPQLHRQGQIVVLPAQNLSIRKAFQLYKGQQHV